MTRVTAPDARWVEFDMNGPLPEQEKWAGPSATPTHTDNVSVQLDYTYDARLRRATSKVTGATGGDDWTAGYNYDKDDAMTTQTLTRTGQTARAYHVVRDTNGLPIRTKLVEGSTTLTSGTMAYDGFGALVESHTTRGAQALADYEFDYDAVGRIERTTETLAGASELELEYNYDQLGRLAQVDEDGSVVRQYTYDLNGNRLNKYDSVAGSITYYTYDAQDRLLRTTDTLNAAEFEFEWSDRGVLTGKTDSNTGDETNYEYDAFGNLLKVTLHVGDVDETDIEYVVDGMGRRIGRKKDGVWTNKFAAGAELTTTTSELVTVFIPDGMISRKDATGAVTSTWTTYRIIKDVRGSVRRVVKASDGTLVQAMDYDEFGNVTYDSKPGFQPLGFAGGVYDSETGLVRFGQRDYDASVGRWTAKDPIGFNGGYNLYAYCGNDPVNAVDLAGTGWLSTGLTILAFCAAPYVTLFAIALSTLFHGMADVMDAMREAFAAHDPNSWQSAFGFTDPGADAPWREKGLAAAADASRYLNNAATAAPLAVAFAGGGGVPRAAASSPGKYAVGSYNSLARRVPGMNAHHVGQQAVMKKLVPGYNPETAPAILVPEVGHTEAGLRGIVSRNTKGFTNARDLIARDIRELRRVYPDIPNTQLRRLIQMNKDMYPSLRK